MLTDIPVQDFKNCFEQWPKPWEKCKQLEGDYFEKNSWLLISLYFYKITLNIKLAPKQKYSGQLQARNQQTNKTIRQTHA
jgi:hypothetical protein